MDSPSSQKKRESEKNGGRCVEKNETKCKSAQELYTRSRKWREKMLTFVVGTQSKVWRKEEEEEEDGNDWQGARIVAAAGLLFC